jgi:hypothetical protein
MVAGIAVCGLLSLGFALLTPMRAGDMVAIAS